MTAHVIKVFVRVVASLALAPLPIACTAGEPASVASPARAVAPPPPPASGRSVEGREIRCLSFGEGRRTILFIGGQHGNEPAGATLAGALARRLADRPGDAMGCRVLVIPALNPDGLVAGTRANANGVDLNRDFPASNAARAAHTPQPETRFVMDVTARHRPVVIVSIHQPLSCVDYDGPGRALAAAMASRIDLEVDKLGARAGSLGSYAGVDGGAAVITLELPGSASRLSSDQLWRVYGPALLEAIRYLARTARSAGGL